MWETTYGCRVLTGPEAKVFVVAAIRLADDQEGLLDSGLEEDGPDLGIRLFDQLTVPQQLVLLHRVTEFLLDPNIPAPKGSALLDAVVAVVFQYVIAELQSELDDEVDDYYAEAAGPSMRQMLTEAYLYTFPEMEMDFPDPSMCPELECDDFDEWLPLIESLHSRICDDQDWAMEDAFLDLPPEEGQALKSVLGINNDYFTDIPENLTAEDGRRARERLLAMYHEQIPEASTYQNPISDLPEVEVDDCVEAFENYPDDWACFVNTSTGAVVAIPDYFLDLDETTHGNASDKEHESLAVEIRQSDHFKPLPSMYDIPEWEIMHKFCHQLRGTQHGQLLAMAVRGPGAFRRFNKLLEELDIKDKWFEHRARAINSFMWDWLVKHKINIACPF